MPDDDRSQLVARLIDAVADGTVDADALAGAEADDALSEMLAQLRVLAGVASVHRTQFLEELEQQSLERLEGDGFALRASLPGGLRRWGSFALLRTLGEGAFGEVYLAQHLLLNHEVALKLLKPHITDSSRILHEAKALARVRQPNVVTVHGVDLHDGRIGFWMDYVDGATLGDVVRSEGVRSIDEATTWAKDLCRALAAVHAAGVIHRDIKADNVIRHRQDGRLILMDFGSGQFADQVTGARMGAQGTPLYLAPELLDGGPATEASDIYALGVLLFFLVTKRYPIEADAWPDLVAAHKEGRRTRLEDVRPDVTPAFGRAVRQMLDPDPLRRFTSVGAAWEALDQTPRRAQPATTARRIAALVGFTLLTASVAGYACSVLYNSPLRRTGGFENESPLAWPLWGLRALIASALVMAGLGLAAVILRQLVDAIVSVAGVRSRLSGFVRTVAAGMFGSDAAVVFTIVGAQLVAVGVSAFLFQDVLRGLDSFISRRPPVDFSALSPARQSRQVWFGLAACAQVMAFGLVWMRVCRERWRSAATDVRGLILAGVLLSVATYFVGQVLPFRILYHNGSERVSFRSQRCYLVGARGDEGRLFCPTDEPWVRAVSLSDPAVVREGVFENIFSGLENTGAVR